VWVEDQADKFYFRFGFLYFQPNKKETTQTGGFRLIKRLIGLGYLQQQVIKNPYRILLKKA
jgi:hypothetical protein